MNELRYALRTLRKTPGFTAVSLLTLALVIGATTSIFTVVNAVLLKRLPYPDPDRLALIWTTQPSRGTVRDQVSYSDVADWRAHAKSFEEVAAFARWNPTLSGMGEAERLDAQQIGDGYFQMMRAKPILGRFFTAEEHIDGRDSVVVLGYGIWQRKFAGDPNIIGKTVSLGTRPHTIVGVMGPEFRPLPRSLVGGVAELYRPVGETISDDARDNRHLRAVARLKPGVSLEQAQSEMNVLLTRMTREFPQAYQGRGFNVVGLHADLVRNLKTALVTLQVAVIAVVLIACANLANLLLARSSARRKETAIRAALGASAKRLIRQALVESALLGGLGGIAGAILATWGTMLIGRWGAKVIPELSNLQVDAAVLAFTACLSLVTGLLFGLVPALQARKTQLIDALKSGWRTSSGASTGRISRPVLVASQVALALVLLIAAGLLLKSFARLSGVDPGFRPSQVMTATYRLSWATYPRGPKQVAFFDQLLSRVRQIPGVETAGVTSVLPLSDNFDRTSVAVNDQPSPPGLAPSPDRYSVSVDYFRAMSIPLVNGRWFTEQDDSEHPQVAIINETAARAWWPGENPIGKKLRVPGTSTRPEDLKTVIGVVGDVNQYGLDAKRTQQFYMPMRQWSNSWMNLVAKTTVPPASIASAIREATRSVDPEQSVTEVIPMEQWRSDSVVDRSFALWLLVAFALGALTLAAIGIYGVISYGVSQRVQEFGIRLSLGASRSEIMSLVIGRGMLPVLIGTAAGVIAAMLLTKAISGLLFGVRPLDLSTYAIVSIFLIAIATVAACIPALRATRVDPMTALRND